MTKVAVKSVHIELSTWILGPGAAGSDKPMRLALEISLTFSRWKVFRTILDPEGGTIAIAVVAVVVFQFQNQNDLK